MGQKIEMCGCMRVEQEELDREVEGGNSGEGRKGEKEVKEKEPKKMWRPEEGHVQHGPKSREGSGP